ncbi:PQQ-binding-like beta-propeller repeat protein [Roseospira navarrensis]|uniref:PQQ-binding-like beta-propeller repeat protein n=1 Tax=Roseospira navarrensis TaxID=140058 RepID=A0A7X1ZGI1_9PROT|nr:PQQ-binding-like beta-propeller repeat protein [Roseospira navarrensis]MQX37594.1 PQQ-binding-like beta-propeller repeat protein [Roseospira navarrensis]
MRVRRNRGIRAALAIAACAGVLAGCDTFGWLGAETQDPLPGQRISVLEREARLSADVTGGAEEILLPAPEPNDDWPMAGGYANHAMHHMSLGDAPQQVWRTDIGAGAGSRDALLSEPVIGGGRIYTIDADAEVRAYDLANGARLWARELPDPDREEDDGYLLGGGIAYGANERLYVTTGFGKVIALDAANGQEIWREDVGVPVRAAPTLNSGRVFVVTVDNQTIALAAQNGQKLWTHAGAEEVASLLGAPAPAVDQGAVIVAYSTGELFALRVETGAVLWQDSVTTVRRTDAAGNLRDIRARPVMAGNRVYVVGHSGLMTAIDLATGERIWQADLGGVQQPWVAGRYLFVMTGEADLAAVSAKDGSILWVTPLQRWEDPEDKEGPVTWTGPLLASDRLVVASNTDEILAISPYDGALLGYVEAPGSVTIPPVLARDTLVILTDSGDLVAYR